MEQPATPSPEAFRAELVASIPALRRMVRSWLRDPHAAEDLVQSVLLKALEHRDQYRRQPDKGLIHWLRAIAHNQHCSRIRREMRSPIVAVETLFDDVSPAPQDSSVALVDAAAVLRGMNPIHAKALLLRANGYEYAEIAAICGVSCGTIRSRLSRAREAFGERMSGCETSGPS